MRAVYSGLALLQLLTPAIAVCVLESEFGFILNCNFKKSGLFRVRNLGGLKAHFGLGFSLGDELGFGESLGNLEGNRRRALNYKTGYTNKIGSVPPKIEAPKKHKPDSNYGRTMTEAMFLPLGVPTFRPIPTTMSNSNSNIRRSDVLQMPSASADDSSLTTTVTDMLQNQVNKTNGIQSYDMMNQFTVRDAIEGEYKNETNDIEANGAAAAGGGGDNSNKILKQSGISNLGHRTSAKNPTSTLVMNAPKEYYPSGYDKNFDDNFRSKVNLPPNNFTCPQQKYFPGLYANIELGCMVFHVCAITEDGIVMKSFLCPESTLFDQSVLKCNWWFYVDCKNSTYDSNIPISKSYQLMKSFSYLSNITTK